MIHIRRTEIQTADAGYWRLNIEGHAGYGPKGGDIVCAAVSALTEALAAQVESLDGTDGIYGRVDAGDGAMAIECWTRESGRRESRMLAESWYDMVSRALAGIAEKYPGNVEYCGADSSSCRLAAAQR